MPLAPVPGTIPCTYADCKHHFVNLKDLKYHKIYEHDFCTRCNEDFSNAESLLLHKIKSEKHIACPICGDDFGSEGGRDLHLRRIHPRDQNIKCPWKDCDRSFKNATDYIRHIENRECRAGPSGENILMRRAMKGVAAHRGGEGSSNLGFRTATRTLTTESAGGVPIDAGERENREAMINQPSHDADDDDEEDDDDDDESVVSQTLSLKHWPKLGTADECVSADEPLDFKKLSLSSKATESASDKNSSLRRAKVSQSPGVANLTLEVPRGVAGQQALRFYRLLEPKFEPNKLLNSYTGKYECCNKKFDNQEQLSEHLILHTDRTVKCPNCRKQFRSVGALMAHCENTEKCAVFRRSDYAKVVDLITGGYVQATDSDGTQLKLEAGTDENQPEKRLTTIIGGRLDGNNAYVKW